MLKLQLNCARIINIQEGKVIGSRRGDNEYLVRKKEISKIAFDYSIVFLYTYGMDA